MRIIKAQVDVVHKVLHGQSVIAVSATNQMSATEDGVCDCTTFMYLDMAAAKELHEELGKLVTPHA